MENARCGCPITSGGPVHRLDCWQVKDQQKGFVSSFQYAQNSLNRDAFKAMLDAANVPYSQGVLGEIVVIKKTLEFVFDKSGGMVGVRQI